MCVDVCVFVSSPKHPLEAIIDMEKKSSQQLIFFLTVCL